MVFVLFYISLRRKNKIKQLLILGYLKYIDLYILLLIGGENDFNYNFYLIVVY